jgi:phosphoribosylanthranilate isomerase
VKVKICGITNTEDALLCENCGADYLGFIFYKSSKRYVSFSNAEEIIKKLASGTFKVGVFVNEEPGMINKAAEFLNLDYVQLHGDENPETAGKIDRKVIKAFRINDSFDFNSIKSFSNAVPLFDTHSQDKFGGTGEKFNWDVIPGTLQDKIILAGGISSANIEYIYRYINPMAVDVSSSLEVMPGRKDKNKVKEFFNKIEQLRSSKW